MTPEEEAYYQANIGDLLEQIHKQADEIKRLEAEKAYWYEISGKQMQTVESQHSQIRKQRLALKKLGEKVRAKHRAWREELKSSACEERGE